MQEREILEVGREDNAGPVIFARLRHGRPRQHLCARVALDRAASKVGASTTGGNAMSTRILAALICTAMVSGCGFSGIMYTASKNGCTVAEQAAAEKSGP